MQQQVRHIIETHWYEYVGMNEAEKILRNCMLIGRTFPIVHELSIIVNINIEFQHAKKNPLKTVAGEFYLAVRSKE